MSHLGKHSTDIDAAWYPPVDIDPEKEIRILELFPGSLDDEICCTISKQALFPDHDAEYHWNDETKDLELNSEDLPPQYSDPSLAYEAVSYTWGPGNDIVPIQVNDIPGFPVTRNLHTCLTRLRLQDRTRRLWADQICVDQHNVAEKNLQVGRTSKVFHQAAEVIVWLGQPNDAPAKLLQWSLRGLKEVSFRDEKRYLLEHESLRAQDSWWTRSWVIQEFGLARKEPIAYFGPHCLPWSELSKICAPRKYYAVHDPDHVYSTLSRRMNTLRAWRQLQGGCSMLSLRWALLYARCSEPKDRLYSLLGILPKIEQEAMVVDYRIDVTETFSRATYQFVVAHGHYGTMAF